MRQLRCDFHFINTGLKAGAHGCRTAQSVLTASFIVPTQPVTIDELSQFLRERALAMMFFLVRDVSRHQVHIGMRNRERTVSPPHANFPVTSSLEFTQWEELPFQSCTIFSIENPVGRSISACT